MNLKENCCPQCLQLPECRQLNQLSLAHDACLCCCLSNRKWTLNTIQFCTSCFSLIFYSQRKTCVKVSHDLRNRDMLLRLDSSESCARMTHSWSDEMKGRSRNLPQNFPQNRGLTEIPAKTGTNPNSLTYSRKPGSFRPSRRDTFPAVQ